MEYSPQHPLVGALTGLSEPLLPVPLVVLLLGDLLNLDKYFHDFSEIVVFKILIQKVILNYFYLKTT